MTHIGRSGLRRISGLALGALAALTVGTVGAQEPALDGVGSGSGARVLILTTFDLDEYAFAALRVGASGFLLKDARPAELVGAIRAVATGDAVVSPRVTRRMLEMFSRSLPAAGDPDPGDLDPRIAHLTPREVEVLRTIAEGLSNGEIAQRFVLSEATVKTHVGRILAKLGVRDRVQAVVLAYETGLVGG